MSRRSRFVWLAAAVAVVVVAVVVIGSGGGSSQSTAKPAPPMVVTVRNLKPVGGVQDLTVNKGGRIRFVVKSDEPEEIHMHGYDIAKEVAPGKPARFDVPARIDGVFEVELEHAGVQIMKLTVNP